jgi:phosphoglycerate dehydrogenase-like enzyme
MTTIAWRQNLTPQKAAEHGVQAVTKEQLFAQSDVLSIHVLLSERTRGLVGAAELESMKPTAILVNTSRGPVLDEDALVDTLREKRISTAAIDVYDVEPLPADHPAADTAQRAAHRTHRVRHRRPLQEQDLLPRLR